jgi:hypothetical protein
MRLTNAVLDFYNNSYFVRSGSVQYAWFSADSFIADTSFPYTNGTMLLSYEPTRDIYTVERQNQIYEYGTEVAEIQWISTNFDRIIEIAQTKQAAETPIVTLELARQVKFYETDWLVQRHQEQIMLNIATTLTNEKYVELLAYRQKLRELTNTFIKTTPAEQVTWPVNPLN